jgi:hypothetical protein
MHIVQGKTLDFFERWQQKQKLSTPYLGECNFYTNYLAYMFVAHFNGFLEEYHGDT